MLKCVNGHDRCYLGPSDDCPYCEKKPKLKRLPIPIDEKVIIELKHLIESRTQKRMSMAAIVRYALDELLKTEAELSE